MHRKSPIKSFKNFKTCFKPSFVRKLHRHIFQHSNAAQASDINSDKDHPTTQTDISAKPQPRMQCTTRVRYASFTRAAKTAGSASRTLTFYNPARVVQPHLKFKHTKTTNRFKRKRRHIDPRHKSCAPAFTYFNLF